MAERIVKDYDERKHEILTRAQELFYSKGYENTSVNDILKAVGIAKGTFYYYFKSKDEVLDAMLMGMSQHILLEVQPIIEDPGLSALEKMKRFYEVSQAIKSANRDLIMTYLRVVYHDDNILMRHKMDKYMMEAVFPEYVKIIRQGGEEGVFNTPWPEDAAEMVFRLMLSMRDSIADMFLSIDEDPTVIDMLDKKIDVYEDAMERILGAPKGSLDLIHREHLKEYLTKPAK